MLTEIKPSDSLMSGVYRIVIILGKDEEQLYAASPFYFELPGFANRTIVPEREYLCPPYAPGDALKGRFIKGIFMAFCFTTGVTENDNHTSVLAVKNRLEQQLADQFNTIRGRASE